MLRTPPPAWQPMAKKILELFGYAPDDDTAAAVKSRNEQTCPRLAHMKLPFELRWVKNSPRAVRCVFAVSALSFPADD